MSAPENVRLGGGCTLSDVGALGAEAPRPEGAGLLPGASPAAASMWRGGKRLGDRRPGRVLDRPAYFLIETDDDTSIKDLNKKLKDAFNPKRRRTSRRVASGFKLEKWLPGTFRLALPVSETELLRRSYGSCGLFYDIASQLREALDAKLVEPDVRHSVWVDPMSSGGIPGCNVGKDQAPLDRDWSFRLIDVPDKQEAGHHDGDGVAIAHIDTGHTDHAELNRGDAFDLNLDLDVEAAPDDESAEDPMPGGNSHGTGTASVITSRPGTFAVDHHGLLGEGITGIAPEARIISVRAIDQVVTFNSGNLIAAVNHAVDSGAHVITMSLGGLFLFGLQKAINRAVDANVIVVAAAGNCIRFVVAPAAYKKCIAAGGCNFNLRRWRGSSRGRRVDVSAPAENVWRAAFNKETGEPFVEPGEGTSFATPAIAGVAALWLAKHGRDVLIDRYDGSGLKLQDVFRSLLRSTALAPPGWNFRKDGAGILNARALLAADLPAPPQLRAAPSDMMSHRDVFELLFEEAPQPRALLQSVVGEQAEEVLAEHGSELNRAFMESREAQQRLLEMAAPERLYRPGARGAAAPKAQQEAAAEDLAGLLNSRASDRLARACNWR